MDQWLKEATENQLSASAARTHTAQPYGKQGCKICRRVRAEQRKSTDMTGKKSASAAAKTLRSPTELCRFALTQRPNRKKLKLEKSCAEGVEKTYRE